MNPHPVVKAVRKKIRCGTVGISMREHWGKFRKKMGDARQGSLWEFRIQRDNMRPIESFGMEGRVDASGK